MRVQRLRLTNAFSRNYNGAFWLPSDTVVASTVAATTAPIKEVVEDNFRLTAPPERRHGVATVVAVVHTTRRRDIGERRRPQLRVVVAAA